jgi:CHAT domain-containing protein
LLTLAAVLACVADRVQPPARSDLGEATLSTPRFVRSGDAARRPVDATRPHARSVALALEQRAYGDELRPDLLWALAMARLDLGEIDDAIHALESAASHDPANAEMTSDLAAAYLQRIGPRELDADLVKAANLGARAVRLDGQLPAARFNLALALDRIGWRERAVEAWQDYAAGDARSPWGQKAREHLRRADRERRHSPARVQAALAEAVAREDEASLGRLAADSPEAARLLVEDTLLPAWVQHASAAPDCVRWSGRVLAIGAAVAAATGDRLIEQLGAELTRACTTPATRARIAEGLAALARARAQAEAGDMASAQAHAERAIDAFGPTTTAGIVADFWRLFAAFNTTLPQDLAPRLATATAEAETRALTYLAARLRLLQGSVALRMARRADALAHYGEATAAFERAREIEYTASTTVLVGQVLREQGDYRQAWPWLLRGLQLLDGIDNPRRSFFVIYHVAQAALDAHLLDFARIVLESLVATAAQWDDPVGWTSALLLQADGLARIGDVPAARAVADAAAVHAARIPGATLRRQIEMQVSLTRGTVLHQADPRQAVDALSSSLDFYQQDGYLHLLAATYLWRGRAHLALGDHAAAEADWRAGIQALEDQRPDIRDEQLRISHMSQLWDLFGELVRLLAVQLDRPAEAAALVERSRARALLDSLARTQRLAPVDPVQAAKTLPSGVVVVMFEPLADGVFAAVFARGTARYLHIPVPHDRLHAQVDLFRSQVERGLPDAQTAAHLYDLLLGPVSGALTGSTLVILPGGTLERLPFAALVNPATGRRLVADVSLGVAPSMTLLALASAHLQSPSPRAAAVLAVGNPFVARTAMPYFRPLPSAEREAREVANSYSTSVLLTGREATKRRFLDAIGEASVVHFAGHAVADTRFPAQSFLLLAEDEPGEGGKVLSGEIAALPLRHVQLAVLSACSTAEGVVGRGEGVLNLARPFLAAGVPQVVASLWDVDDRATYRLLAEFHRQLRGGKTVLDALAHAQRALMEEEGELGLPRHWAAFTAIGGVASSQRYEQRSHGGRSRHFDSLPSHTPATSARVTLRRIG